MRRNATFKLVLAIQLTGSPTMAASQVPLKTFVEPSTRTCYAMPPSGSPQPITLPDSVEAVTWAARAVGLTRSPDTRVISYLIVKDEGILIREGPRDSTTLDGGGLAWIGADRCVVMLRK
jgi:hypothetical protein